LFLPHVGNRFILKSAIWKLLPMSSTTKNSIPRGIWRRSAAVCVRRFLAAITTIASVSYAAPQDLNQAQRTSLSDFYMPVTRIVWQSDRGVKNADHLLQHQPGQALLRAPTSPTELKAVPGHPAGLLIDFGQELQGYIEIFTPMMPNKNRLRHVRIRFGESASEAMADLGGSHNASNIHAIRDRVVTVPWLGKTIVGPGGFRFVRIDNFDPALAVELSEVRAVLQIRDIPYLGSFMTDDERLNRIWKVGSYTVQLNMQDYLWDGIKRDRLVWLGDMHPEVSTIDAVFGFNDVVPKSLDLIRDVTPPATQWMNGIPSYSMWWVLIQEEIWMHQGNRAYLEAQRPYLKLLLERLASLVGPDGKERVPGWRFLDWSSADNPDGITAGLQALLVMTLESGARLMTALGDSSMAQVCRTAAKRGRQVVPDPNGSKSGAALLSLAGMVDAKKTADDILRPGGAKRISPYYGFYVLQALTKAGEIDTALDFIRTYWGAMLDLGATTFWEDFNIEWTRHAARIDELVPAGKKDVHGDFGAYDFKGFTLSLCHGWASGPTAWLSQTVLGITPLEPGFTRVRIQPHLGRLKWAEGTYPTPLGLIHVRHERQPDGTIRSKIDTPRGMRVDRITGS
jgi:hypothetical protein